VTDTKIKQVIQESIAEIANKQGNLQTIGTAAAIAGTISLAVFFVINAQVDNKTRDLRIEQAVLKNQLKTNERLIHSANGGIDGLGVKFDTLMFEVLKSRKD